MKQRRNKESAAADPAAGWAGRLGVERLLAELARPVDGASAAFWRIAFGLVMMADLLFYAFDGRLERLYLGPVMHFKYPFFAWVTAASPGVMYAVTWLGLAAALAVAAGFFYRVAAAVLFGVLAYFYLLEVTAYNNHNYLFCLFAFLCIFLPLDQAAAVGAGRAGGARRLPAWVIWLLRFQVGVPYFFGGLAKLNYDWLVRAQPMKQWMRTDNLGGTLQLQVFQQDWFAYFLSWSGAAFDLLVVPALLWRRSRPWAFVLLLLFNVGNSQLFDIGMFPWAMILLSTIFFEPHWPRRLGLIPTGKPPGGAGATKAKPAPAAAEAPRQLGALTRWALGAWVVWQLAMPLRHYLYPGNTDWTEEGHRYAWRMKIRDKQGEIRYMLFQRQTQQAVALQDAEALLTERQQRFLSQDPELMRQFAHFLAGGLRAKGYQDFEIRAFTNFSLNERPAQPLIDPEVDLAAQPEKVLPKRWIVPLKPLP